MEILLDKKYYNSSFYMKCEIQNAISDLESLVLKKTTLPEQEYINFRRTSVPVLRDRIKMPMAYFST